MSCNPRDVTFRPAGLVRLLDQAALATINDDMIVYSKMFDGPDPILVIKYLGSDGKLGRILINAKSDIQYVGNGRFVSAAWIGHLQLYVTADALVEKSVKDLSS